MLGHHLPLPIDILSFGRSIISRIYEAKLNTKRCTFWLSLSYFWTQKIPRSLSSQDFLGVLAAGLEGKFKFEI